MFFKGSRESVLLSVTAECPTETGAVLKVPFKARYRCPSQTEARQLVEDATAEIKQDDDIVADLLIGWEGVKDKDDEAIEYNEENAKEAMDYPPYRAALVKGAMQILFGKEILRRKNSKTPGGRS